VPAGGEPPRPRRSLTKYKWPAAALIVVIAGAIGAVVALSSGSSPNAGSGGGAVAGGVPFAASAHPVPTNRVIGSGTARVQLAGNTVTVSVDTQGLLNGSAHAMHIHAGAQGICPPESAARLHRGHLSINTGDGIMYYGPPAAALTTSGDTSTKSIIDFPRFPAVGSIRYTRTFTITPVLADEIRAGNAVIVVHGIDYNGNGTYTNFLGQGAEAAAPALCGPLFPSTTASTGTNGGHGVVYTASLGVLSGSTPGSPAPLLLCHIAGTPVSLPPSSSAGSGGAPAPA
jgi:hypothetical protein